MQPASVVFQNNVIFLLQSLGKVEKSTGQRWTNVGNVMKIYTSEALITYVLCSEGECVPERFYGRAFQRQDIANIFQSLECII